MGSRGAANDVVAFSSEKRVASFGRGLVLGQAYLLCPMVPLSPQNDPKANCERAKALSFRV